MVLKSLKTDPPGTFYNETVFQKFEHFDQEAIMAMYTFHMLQATRFDLFRET